MNSKKIIIYDYDILFDILYEIKDYLNYEFIKADLKNFNKINNEINSDFLIISQKENNELRNNLIINERPIRINKLSQIINVKFLKYKFNSQSKINIGKYILDLNSRLINKGPVNLDLTEREINLIIYLNNSAKPVKIDVLQKEVWGHGSKLETHTVETHIYRLRKKIKEKFNDENFISSFKEGYKIN